MFLTISPLQLLAEKDAGRLFAVQVTANVNVVVGVLSRNCEGHGICKVLQPNLSVGHLGCQVAPAWVEINEQGVIRFRFPKDGLCPTLRQRQFSYPFFHLEDDFLLPDWLTRKLRLPRARLRAGAYPIGEEQGCFIVCFYGA